MILKNRLLKLISRRATGEEGPLGDKKMYNDKLFSDKVECLSSTLMFQAAAILSYLPTNQSIMITTIF